MQEQKFGHIVALKDILDSLYVQRSSLHRENDPISFCHRFEDPLDQEIVGLVASSLAYGNVRSILRSLEAVITKMTPSPRRFIEEFDMTHSGERFARFKHRFNDSRDLCALFFAARKMIEEADSIGKYFTFFYDLRAEDLTSTISAFTREVLRMDYSSIFGSREFPADSYFAFFFPSPSDGSACKRLCMYLRWMVRPADGVDLGLWREISPAQLVIPVDAHIKRISSFLGFTSRRQPDWRMAREITVALKEYEPDDPIKYDFSLCHLGISEGCNGRRRSACLACVLSKVCGGRVE
jgi:uncharacterized protein (TIGR02757 family)